MLLDDFLDNFLKYDFCQLSLNAFFLLIFSISLLSTFKNRCFRDKEEEEKEAFYLLSM